MPMTPERHQQIVDLCQAAWDLNLESRAGFLNRACDADDELRREVEAMLAADEQASQFLGEPPHEVASEVLGYRQSRSLIGKTLGEYQVIGALGRGGMGDVFLAHDKGLGRKAALKLLPIEYASDPARLRRFEQEACAVSALNHPNIVTIFGLGRAGPVTFLATEFVPGRTLRQELANGPLPPHTVIEIALQAALALSAAHQTGIIHRDIKPENIILRTDGLVKVLDFGLAKWTENRTEVNVLQDLVQTRTSPGLIMGTPQYMSPEQARGIPVDFQTDLFSFGSVLYEMLSGAPAMTGETPSDILAAVLVRDPVPLEKLCPECPAALVSIVNRALEKDRDKRYKSADEMVADLKIVRREMDSGVFVPAGAHSAVCPDGTAFPGVSTARRVHKRFWISLFAALGGVLVGIYGVQHVPSSEMQPLAVTPLTTLPGNQVQPSLSPDGKRVAFAFDRGGSSNYNIYAKSIGSEEITRLTSNAADDLSPSWSPDGQSIAFLRFVSYDSALVLVMSSAGGAERQLAKLRIERDETEIRVAWSPDGEWIATSDMETPLSPMRLVLISSITGRKRRLTYQPPAADADLSPSFSPDGRYLAYARHLSFPIADIYILEIPNEAGPATEARPLTRWNRKNRSPVWSGDGKEVFFIGDEPRIGPRIWRAPAFGRGEARRINQIGERSTSIALSPRSRRLVYSKEMDDWNIWRLDLARASGARSQTDELFSRVIASTYGDDQPQYSPDGKHIAFESDRSGDSEIWIANGDGSSPRQLTRLHARISGYPRWSPDAKYIVFHSRPNGYANLYRVAVDTGSYRALTTGRTNDAAASWSHDGKWIYFQSLRNGSPQIWRIPAEGGPASQVTKNGGVIAFDSANGKLLFYSKSNAPGLWMLPLDGGIESQVLPCLYGNDTFGITKTGIYFACRTADNKASLRFMSFSPRFTKEIVRIKAPIGSNFSVSPDGSSLLYQQADQIGSDLVLVDDFK
jgi:eukaryotic-like serine/threonine-protein kinase